MRRASSCARRSRSARRIGSPASSVNGRPRRARLDGYRLCLRDAADVVAIAAVPPAPSDGDAGSARHGSATRWRRPASAHRSRSSRALGRVDEALAIEAIVTAPATLLDATGRRIVVQDASAAIEVLLPSGADAPAVGTRIRASGRVGLAYGAPRLRADEVTVIGNGRCRGRSSCARHPTGAQEWRLVSITGRIDDVKKLGDRWRAEMLVSAARVVVVGQPGAGIDVSALAEGRMATSRSGSFGGPIRRRPTSGLRSRRGHRRTFGSMARRPPAPRKPARPAPADGLERRAGVVRAPPPGRVAGRQRSTPT